MAPLRTSSFATLWRLVTCMSWELSHCTDTTSDKTQHFPTVRFTSFHRLQLHSLAGSSHSSHNASHGTYPNPSTKYVAQCFCLSLSPRADLLISEMYLSLLSLCFHHTSWNKSRQNSSFHIHCSHANIPRRFPCPPLALLTTLAKHRDASAWLLLSYFNSAALYSKQHVHIKLPKPCPPGRRPLNRWNLTTFLNQGQRHGHIPFLRTGKELCLKQPSNFEWENNVRKKWSEYVIKGFLRSSIHERNTETGNNVISSVWLHTFTVKLTYRTNTEDDKKALLIWHRSYTFASICNVLFAGTGNPGTAIMWLVGSSVKYSTEFL